MFARTLQTARQSIRNGHRNIRPEPIRYFHSTPATMVQEIKSMKEFQASIGQPKLTVVDFYATWCGPCKAIEPIFHKFEEKFSEADFVRVDVDEANDVAMEYGVTAMPTFMLFKDGAKLTTIVGANPAALQKSIEKFIAE